MPNTHIAVVDDERNICLSVESILDADDRTVHSFTNPDEAIKSMVRTNYALVILDIRIGEVNGIELLKKMRDLGVNSPVVFISGNASLHEAAQTLKLGAYDFLEKPFSAEKLLACVQNCLEYHELQKRYEKLNQANRIKILGEHPSIVKLRDMITRCAQTDATVLISGESGTGKELIAESIHQQSKRASADFIKVNCSAIPEDLIDSALFGHVKGAFTGADKEKKGFFELADGGSIFLDEIGDMPLSAQSSLLRVLENSEIQTVGSEAIKKIDVRIIAASHQNLKQAITEGRFREDLFYRLNVVPLVSVPLRERKDDLVLLFNALIERNCKRHGLPYKAIAPECYEVLSSYDWPGNVRELNNVAERMLILSGDTLTINDIPPELMRKETVSNGEDIQTTSQDHYELSWRDFREQAEREYLAHRLRHSDGNISKLAKTLGLDRTYLYRKLASLGLK